jgi:anti-sigma regulatory factor (Ser/Thr protein kinase)
VGTSHVEVRMVAQPASVPAARRFVNEALAGWGCETLAEDIGLCVSELATNATLHSGSSYFRIELQRRSGAVRLAVADNGMGSVDVLARQPELSGVLFDEQTAGHAAATGRGMFLVSALATTWGIDELAAGKRVWAEFGADPSADGTDADSGTVHVTRSAQRQEPEPDPQNWAVVRFRGCPAALLVEHDENLAEYTRELYLVGERLADPSFHELAAELAEYVASHAANWDPARIIAREAVRDGRELVDIDVLAGRDVRRNIGLLRALIARVESLSRAGKLMTLPAAEPVQWLRNWLEGEFLAQIEDGAEPLPYSDWLAGVRR